MSFLSARPAAADTRPSGRRAPLVRVPTLDCALQNVLGYQRGKSKPISVVRIDGRPVEMVYRAYLAGSAADGPETDVPSPDADAPEPEPAAAEK